PVLAWPMPADRPGAPPLVERDGPIARVTLNRPDQLNTLNRALVDALVEQSAALASDDAIRVVILRGAGRHFMAGGDLNEFATMLAESGAGRRGGVLRVLRTPPR